MANDPRLGDVLALIRASFAYMNGLIDPPSSMHGLTLANLQSDAAHCEIWATPDACMILTPQDKTLYLGKLAVAAPMQGQGLARAMIDHAVTRAIALEKPTITLQTRVELHDNQCAFRALGFREINRTAHPGFARPTSVTFARSV